MPKHLIMSIKIMLLIGLIGSNSQAVYGQMFHYNAIFEDEQNDKIYYVLWGGNYTHKGTEYACLCIHNEERPTYCQSVLINSDFHDFSHKIRSAFSNDGQFIALLKEKEIDGVLTPVRLDINYLPQTHLMHSFNLSELGISSVRSFEFNENNLFMIKHDKGMIKYQVE
jgi:hypothetical protein